MDIPILDHVKAVVTVGNIVKSQNLFVVKDLITPVILGTDFLQEHRILLDFTMTPFTVAQSETRSQHSSAASGSATSTGGYIKTKHFVEAEQVF